MKYFLPLLLFASPVFACPQHCLCDRHGNVISDHRYLRSTSDARINQTIANSSQASSTSTATSAATATGGTSTANQTQQATGGNATGGSSSDTMVTSVPRQVATAYVTPLTASPGTCLGSAGAGLQLPFGGASVGSTKVDSNCVLQVQVIMLHNLGQDRAACFRARQDAAIDRAFRDAGVDCPENSPAAEPSNAVTHDELNRALTRVLSK